MIRCADLLGVRPHELDVRPGNEGLSLGLGVREVEVHYIMLRNDLVVYVDVAVFDGVLMGLQKECDIGRNFHCCIAKLRSNDEVKFRHNYSQRTV